MPLRAKKAELQVLTDAANKARDGENVTLKVENPAMAKQRLFTARATRNIECVVGRVDPKDSDSAVEKVTFTFPAAEEGEDGGKLTLLKG